LSYASWFVSEKSWIQPVSRTPIASLWSLLMLMGPESARFETASVIGSRSDAATYSISVM